MQSSRSASDADPLPANTEGIRDDAAQVAGAPEMAEDGGEEKANGNTPPYSLATPRRTRPLQLP
jgi:hypothetical protein